MAVLTVADWTTLTGIAPTGDDLGSVVAFCAAVSDALERMCYPVLLEPLTLTMRAFDAPTSGPLVLPRPVRSITAVYLHPRAGGDSSVVDAVADLLVAGTDYYSPVTDQRTGWNRAGEVYRLNSSAWGYQLRRPLGRLGWAAEEDRGAVFVSGEFGPTSVPPAAQAAAATAVTLMYNRRAEGAPYASESWNGRSQSLAGPYTAEAAIRSPDVLGMLQAAGLLPFHTA